MFWLIHLATSFKKELLCWLRWERWAGTQSFYWCIYLIISSRWGDGAWEYCTWGHFAIRWLSTKPFCAASNTGIIRLKILTLNGEVIMETSCGTTLVPRLIESCKQPLRMVTGALEWSGRFDHAAGWPNWCWFEFLGQQPYWSMASNFEGCCELMVEIMFMHFYAKSPTKQSFPTFIFWFLVLGPQRSLVNYT